MTRLKKTLLSGGCGETGDPLLPPILHTLVYAPKGETRIENPTIRCKEQ